MSALRRLFAGIDDPDAAKAEVTVARARLIGTIEEIHARLAPANLLEEALGEARTRSAALARYAGEEARKRPVTVAAVAIAIGLLIARKPVMALLTKLLRRGEETPEADRQLHP